MSEIEDLKERLARVETLAGFTDSDTADLKGMMRSQTTLIQALRETQNSMSRVLGEQGTALGEMVVAWTRTSERLAAIERAQLEHGRKLDELLRRLPGTSAGAAD